jgi:hypothetical protein
MNTFNNLFTYSDTDLDRHTVVFYDCEFQRDFYNYEKGDTVNDISFDIYNGELWIKDENFKPYYGRIYCLKIGKLYPISPSDIQFIFKVYQCSTKEKSEETRKLEKLKYFLEWVTDDYSFPDDIDDLDVDDFVHRYIQGDFNLDKEVFDAEITEINPSEL